jgi:hypothetical protein
MRKTVATVIVLSLVWSGRFATQAPSGLALRCSNKTQ